MSPLSPRLHDVQKPPAISSECVRADRAPVTTTPPRSNHVCEVYSGIPRFRERAIAYLTEGRAAGQLLRYLGHRHLDDIRSSFEQVPALDGSVACGDLHVGSLEEMYGRRELLDPAAQVRAYARATENALARGYTGLRVVVDATHLVDTPARRAAFASYEHLIDRYLVDHPMFAMCAYDARELGRDAAAEIACLHPVVHGGPVPFRWHAADEADIGLAGEVDLTCWDLFDRTLATTMSVLPHPRVVVDARALSFLDHRAMLMLEHHAMETGRRVVLRTNERVVHRLAELLSLQAVHTESW